MYDEAFIPQVIFAPFQDKAAPRHLMLLIPPLAYFIGRPVAAAAAAVGLRNRRGGGIGGGLVLSLFLAAGFLSSLYITFAAPHWEYKVLRMRREYAEFVRDRMDEYYFYIVRGKFPLYLQNRIVDFITYPRVKALHYHLPEDYPRPGKSGKGREEKYAYVSPRHLPELFAQIKETGEKTGFVFEQKELIPIFEKEFGPGSVREKARDCAPWVYYLFIYRPAE